MRFGLSVDMRQKPAAFTPEPVQEAQRRSVVQLLTQAPTAPASTAGEEHDLGLHLQPISWLDRNKTLLYVAGGLAAFGAMFLLFRRKPASVAGYRRGRRRR